MIKDWILNIFQRLTLIKEEPSVVEDEIVSLPQWLEDGDSRSPMPTEILHDTLGVSRHNPVIYNNMNEMLLTFCHEFLTEQEFVKEKDLNCETFSKLVASKRCREHYLYYACHRSLLAPSKNNSIFRDIPYRGILYTEMWSKI